MIIFKRTFVLFILIFSLETLVSEEFRFDPHKIADPTKNNSWITVYGGYITESEQTEINAIIDGVKNETGAEIAVVVVPNTGGDIFSAAQKLFDLWKIGEKGKDNGILLLVSMEERQFRTHTGYGVEAILPDATCRTLQERHIVPDFREAQYAKGIISYLNIIFEILKNPDYLAEQAKMEEEKRKKEAEELSKIIKARKRRMIAGILIIAGAIFMIGFVLIAYTIISASRKIKKSLRSYTEIGEIKRTGLVTINPGWYFLIFMFGGLALVVGSDAMKGYYRLALIIPVVCFLISIIIHNILRKIEKNIVYLWRTMPRNCPECKEKMRKLKEDEDDLYLTKGQKREESILSKDYDVWICESCGTKTVENFEAKNYRYYTECPECKNLTAKQTASKTITEATYSSEGSKIVTFECLNCGHKYEKQAVISKLIHYSSYSSGSSYSGSSSSYKYSYKPSSSSSSKSSSSSRSSYSSSSSSGRSYGGGSSGGGGATSSW